MAKRIVVAAMQPTYLPWAGYFNLMLRSDVFVLLDDCQFCRGTWHNRQRILRNGREHWLSIPVLSGRGQRQRLCEAMVNIAPPWETEHADAVTDAYRDAPHGQRTIDLTAGWLWLRVGTYSTVAQCTSQFIEMYANLLGIKTPIYYASRLNPEGIRSERLLWLCRHFGATTYYSAAGSREYIEADGVLQQAGIEMVYQDFDAQPYPQHGATEFVPRLSIVDVIANLGVDGARDYIDAGDSQLSMAELRELKAAGCM